MHVLTPQAGGIEDGRAPVDLNQETADVVFLSSADTEIAGLARAKAGLKEGPSLRLANVAQLGHPFSVDLYVERTLARARLIVLRLIGGPNYWRYGTDEVVRHARGNGVKLIVLSGTQEFDPGLADLCGVSQEACRRLFSYLVEGGPENYRNALLFINYLLGGEEAPLPQKLPKAGVLKVDSLDLNESPYAQLPPPNLPLSGGGTVHGEFGLFPLLERKTCGKLKGISIEGLGLFPPPERGRVREGVAGREATAAQLGPLPTIALVFYRALVQSADLDPIYALAAAVSAEGFRCLPIFVSSLKDPEAAAFVEAELAASGACVVLNATAFALASGPTPLDRGGAPVLQIAFSGMDEARWLASARGLDPRDLAMHVAMPEIDGRVFVRAVSFKGESRFDPETQTSIISHRPRADRIVFAAKLAAAWGRLARAPRSQKRVAFILSNGAADEGRIGHAVGLDATQSVVEMMKEMKAAGFGLGDVPETGDDLVERLIGSRLRVSRDLYLEFIDSLENTLRESLTMFWGDEVSDSFYSVESEALEFTGLISGNVAVLVQPARGGGESRSAQHDPVSPPPHGYVAAYAWLRKIFQADVIVHMGKHGSLEWLPGKAVALSSECWPEALLGPTPCVYPFVVNDPGEGSQAKRRLAAVIVDHLIPPLRRAGAYGALGALDALADEYRQATGLDPRRAASIATRILEQARSLGDLNLPDDQDEALAKLDAFLCDLKDLPIRDGLHVFGRVPAVDSPLLGAGRALIEASAAAETSNLLRALDGRFIPSGPSGAPTRGRLDVLPTGRNFYSVDPRALPTETAWDIGRRTAEETATAYVQDHGRFPRRIALSAWGTSAMRTGGDDIAQVLAFIGARPVWEESSKRVTGFEILSLQELRRPRIDVTVRISGFFRDAFPTQIDLMASAFRAVAEREEPVGANPLREEPKLARIFSSAPGGYGTGLKDLIDSGKWENRTDFGRAFIQSGGFAYGMGDEGAPAAEAFGRLLAETDAVVQTQDAREFDLLDSGDFFEFEGGFAAAAEAMSGVRPAVYHADSSSPDRPRVRRLEEEIALIVRGRAANPVWIAGVKRHGYRGAGEIAQTVTSLFAFAATTGLVPSSCFEALHAAYLEDDETRSFLEEKNPAVLRDVAARFAEAIDRGLWRPQSNSLRAGLDDLMRKDAA